MRRAGQALSAVFLEVANLMRPGQITLEIDQTIEKLIRGYGAIPAFKGYHGNGNRAFPASCCISIDREVVHGIPSSRRLEEGQIVGVDAGLRLDNWYADMAGSFLIGECSTEKKTLWSVTRESLYCGIERAIPGNLLSDVGGAIQDRAESSGFSVVRDLVGHGIGMNLHEEPAVPNYRTRDANILLKPGMTLAIEPMLGLGTHRIKVLSDGWTAVTTDGLPSGHFEHTIVITENGPEILTLLEDGSDPWFRIFLD
jgi:methionyl aminopeptidase